MIDEKLASVRAEHAQEIAGIQVQLDEARKAAAGAPVTFVPEHAGGPGTEIAETWSAWEQSLAHAAAEAARAAGSSANRRVCVVNCSGLVAICILRPVTAQG